MTTDAEARAGAHPSLALAVHIENLVRARRVAVLGDASLDLPERLGKAGARLIHVYDPDPARTAEAMAKSAGSRIPHGPHITHAVLEGDMGVRDGAFDIVVIPDLSFFADRSDILRRARRLVAHHGATVIASPNPAAGRPFLSRPPKSKARVSGPSYYELYDLVALQFPIVRMLGQAPFVGYTLADFAPEGEPVVSVDTSLLEKTAEPEWFIAVGSERHIELEPYAVIQIPPDRTPLFAAADTPSVIEDRLALTEARARLALLGAEIEELRERHKNELREAETRAQNTASLSARIVELEAAIVDKENEIQAVQARHKDIQSRAGDSHVRAERLSHQVSDLEEELRRQRDRATKLAKQLDDEKKIRTKLEMELGMMRNKPELLGAKDRLTELSNELAQARARIGELETVLSNPPERIAPPMSTPNPHLIARIAELEMAIQDARHAAADAHLRWEHAEKRAAELSKLESAVLQERALQNEKRTELEAKCALLEYKNNGLEGKNSALVEQTAELSEKLDELLVLKADLERERETLSQQASARLKDREHLERSLEAQEERFARLNAQNELSAAALAELKQRLAKIDEQREEAASAVVGDLSSAETTLRERGRRIAELESELRESRRIGRELVEEVEALRAMGSSEIESVEATNAANERLIDELRARLDALALRSAKTEADYQSASWKIAQQERELSEALSGSLESAEARRALEKELAAARDDLLRLRRELSESERHAAELQRSVANESVLLNQTAGMSGREA